MTALFVYVMPLPDSSYPTRKFYNSYNSSDAEETRRLENKECKNIQEAQRASILDEDMRQDRVCEIGVDTSSRLSINEGVTFAGEGATNLVPIVDSWGFEKMDPPAS